jgi:hypothetical protein
MFQSVAILAIIALTVLVLMVLALNVLALNVLALNVPALTVLALNVPALTVLASTVLEYNNEHLNDSKLMPGNEVDVAVVDNAVVYECGHGGGHGRDGELVGGRVWMESAEREKGRCVVVRETGAMM